MRHHLKLCSQLNRSIMLYLVINSCRHENMCICNECMQNLSVKMKDCPAREKTCESWSNHKIFAFYPAGNYFLNDLLSGD